MPKDERRALIREIQSERNSFLISYVTSTRQGLEVPMAMDCIRRVYEHLRRIQKLKEDVHVDLFLQSNGGDGTVPWRLVTLIREYASKLSVLVPYRAFSAATLTALGADSIIMHPMGMLGPTDPTVTNPFNPTDTNGQPVGISVEDVTAYIALIKEDAGIQHEDELVQAFKLLAEKVHPLALGNVKRSISQSRMMAKKLLMLHMDGSKQHDVDEIVDNLTSKLYYHGHPINRREAKDQIKLSTVEDPSPAVEDLMWRLFQDYEGEIQMEKPFHPGRELLASNPSLPPGQPTVTPIVRAKLAFIESEELTHVLFIDYVLSGIKHPDGMTAATVIVNRQDWDLE